LRKRYSFPSGQRFGYFMKKENNTKSLDSFQSRSFKTVDLTSMYVKKQQGDLIQMDNIVSIEEQVSHHNCITTIDLWRLPCLRVSSGKSINDGIEQWKKLKPKVLDDTFTTDLGGNLEILLRVVLILHLLWVGFIINILIPHNLKVLLIRLSLF
jgi:hypothetical protein